MEAHEIKPYYFNSKKQGELDFVIELNGSVVPIEVKSGKDYKKHSALENVLKAPNYAIDKAIILCDGNVEQKSQRVYLPIYMIMFLQQKELENQIVTIDLQGIASR